MKENIKFLNVLDIERKHNQPLLHQTSTKQSKIFNKRHKFPFFKALNLSDEKFSEYPKWLTNRQDFMAFMYKNYESKLMIIPKICEKQIRTSDEKYMIFLYLEQVQLFKNLPSLVMDIILSEIKIKTYQTGSIIHNQEDNMQFMALIFVGRVQYTKNNKIFTKHRNEVIMTEAFYKSNHPTIVSKQQTVLLYLHKNIYKKIQSSLKTDLFKKSPAQISDMMKSDFFVQLHLKQKRANNFYEELSVEFFFKDEQIIGAGQEASKFYLHFKGDIEEKNHIYIREHNKWPLPNKRWEVRAVYQFLSEFIGFETFQFFW